ncbi:LBP / BPI / CETP familyN-terminal domain containing protein [Aphelenchoides avenae]|nr:LBP / BPI / CETP familyN-terminal domain containing protein [Aphelenchus avenae]
MIAVVSLLCVFLSVAEAVQEQSTLAARLSKAGLQFFSNIGHKIITHELPKIEYPDITLPFSGGPGEGTVTVRRLRIPTFESPRFNFELSPPYGLTWHSKDGSVKVRGLWKASYTWLVTVHTDGWLELTAADIRSVITLGVQEEQQRPQLEVFNCSVALGQVDLEIGGGVIPWLVNLFRSGLSATLKEVVHQQFCATARDVILVQANDALMNLPTHVPITDGIYLDYALIKDPEVTDTYVEGAAYIDVLYGNTTCDLPAVNMSLAHANEEYMLNVWCYSIMFNEDEAFKVSESIFNCLAESTHNADILKFTVDKNLYAKLSVFLQTSCGLLEVCLGKFFPILKERYPNQYVDLVFHSAEPPLANITRNGVALNTKFFVDFHIYPAANHSQVLARIDVVNDRIVGKLNDTTVSFKQVQSRIGNFSERLLSTFGLVLKPLLETALDTALRVGVPIPLVENVALANRTDVLLLDGNVRVASDLVYKDNLLTLHTK